MYLATKFIKSHAFVSKPSSPTLYHSTVLGNQGVLVVMLCNAVRLRTRAFWNKADSQATTNWKVIDKTTAEPSDLNLALRLEPTLIFPGIASYIYCTFTVSINSDRQLSRSDLFFPPGHIFHNFTLDNSNHFSKVLMTQKWYRVYTLKNAVQFLSELSGYDWVKFSSTYPRMYRQITVYSLIFYFVLLAKHPSVFHSLFALNRYH